MTAPVTSPTTQARAELMRLARMALSFEHADVEDQVAALSPLDRIAADDAFRALVEAIQAAETHAAETQAAETALNKLTGVNT